VKVLERDQQVDMLVVKATNVDESANKFKGLVI
jgi:hypothetical protein